MDLSVLLQRNLKAKMEYNKQTIGSHGSIVSESKNEIDNLMNIDYSRKILLPISRMRQVEDEEKKGKKVKKGKKGRKIKIKVIKKKK